MLKKFGATTFLILLLYWVSVYARSSVANGKAAKHSLAAIQKISAPWSSSGLQSICSKLRCENSSEDIESYIDTLRSAMGDFVKIERNPQCNFFSGKIGKSKEFVSATWVDCILVARYQFGLFKITTRSIEETSATTRAGSLGDDLKFLEFSKIELIEEAK